MSLDLPTPEKWAADLFDIDNNAKLEELMMWAYRIQYAYNPIYQRFCDLTNRTPGEVRSTDMIPYLPISFFKSEMVLTGRLEVKGYFESSGTTGVVSSRHYYTDLRLYESVFTNAFERFYGPVENYCVLALLPSYLERGNSSLVYMVDKLMKKSGHPLNGSYLHGHTDLARTMERLEKEKQPTILIGVTYALLDFAEKFPMPLQHTIIMETGGMKGRRKEMVRTEVHDILKKQFQLDAIHSEYGMTELFSQAYSKGEGRFVAPPWMRVSMREADDPLAVRSALILPSPALPKGREHSVRPSPTLPEGREHFVQPSPALPEGREYFVQPSPALPEGREHSVGPSPTLPEGREHSVRPSPTLPEGREHSVRPSPTLPEGRENDCVRNGVILIADLANIHSCCFIATEDQGKMYEDGSFEVLGRIDNSDIRGCSLMVS